VEAVYAHLEGRTDRYEDEYRVRTRSGEWKWILSRGKVVERDRDGKPLRMVGTYRDITERKLAEDALAEKEARYRTIFESMSDGVAIYKVIDDGTDFVFVDFNKAATRMFGITSENVLGRSIRDVLSGADDSGLLGVLRTTWRTGRPAHLPVSKYHDERIEIFTENFVASLPSGEVVAVFRDVTESKLTDDAVREARGLLESILAAVPVGIALHRNRQVQWANEAWAKMFGFGGQDECVGQETRVIYPSDVAYELARESFYDSLAAGGVREIDTRLKRKDGAVFDAIIRTRALDPSDPAKGIIGAIADVSERKQAEEALRESEAKYRATFDNAAVGIDLVDSHGRFLEVNGMLCTLLGYTEDELRALTIYDVTHPEDVEMSAEKHAELLGGEIDKYRLEKRYMKKMARSSGQTRQCPRSGIQPEETSPRSA